MRTESSDGVTWTQRDSGTENDLFSVRFAQDAWTVDRLTLHLESLFLLGCLNALDLGLLGVSVPELPDL